MKISEVIKKLQEIQAEKGDLLVRIELGDFDVSFGSMDLKVYGNSLYIEQLWNTEKTNEQRT